MYQQFNIKLVLALNLIVIVSQSQRYFQLYTDPDCLFQPGKFWNGQTCLECKNENCQCNQEYGCTHCKDNYYYNTELQDCFKCPEGCKDCCMNSELSLISCTSCFTDYFKISGSCIYLSNCLVQNLGFCQQCQTGYYLDKYHKCQSCDFLQQNGQISKCSKCNINTYCTQCSEGYYLIGNFNSKGYLICNQCTQQQCAICENNVCSKCIQGYILNDNQECEPCIIEKCSLCQIDSGQQICSQCQIIKNENTETGNIDTIEYYIRKIDNVYECVTCQDYFPNCFQCVDPQLSDIYCQLCQEGYYKNENCEDDNTQCCLKCPENVKKCYSQESIQQCNDGYLLVKDEVQGLTCIQNVNNCALVNTSNGFYVNNSCQTCKLNDYKNDQQQCITCNVQNCIKCINNQPNQCEICSNQYYQNNNLCEQCTVQNCIKCQEQQDQCQTCSLQYRLEQQTGQCISCTDSNCQKCDNQVNQCQQCMPGYGFQEDLLLQEQQQTCNHCIEGCLQCNKQKTCIECQDDYYLHKIHQACIPKIKNCLEMMPKYQYEIMIEIDKEKKKELQNQQLTASEIESQPMYCKLCDVDVENNKHYTSKGYACTWCNNPLSGTLDCPMTCKPFQYPILIDTLEDIEDFQIIKKFNLIQYLLILFINLYILKQL